MAAEGDEGGAFVRELEFFRCTVGAGIAVAGVLVLGSWRASAMPASGVALIHAIQKAEPVARYHIPRYRRCRIVGYGMDRYGYCVPSRYG
jgi:hypothetical protein